MKIYRNGDRYSVALYGERMCTPVFFGTGGDLRYSDQSFEDIFCNPEKYSIKPFDNTWRDNYIVAVDPYQEGEKGEMYVFKKKGVKLQRATLVPFINIPNNQS